MACEGNHSQVIIMGMSRSGSSLTASIVAALLGHQPGCWHGSGVPLRSDTHNRLGYFERHDVVSLNHQLASAMSGHAWYSFPPDFAGKERSAARLARSSTAAWRARTGFDEKARRIVADMDAYAPWLLKDVRFARTLPVWRPHLSSPICIIPYRHPAEVASSSAVRSVDR
jgi:hypothetical protein